MKNVKVVPARPSDLKNVLGILHETSDWLAEKKGIFQWRPGSISESLIEDQIRRGEVHLVSLGDEIIGTVTLQWTDMPFWENQKPEAGYIHRLALRPQYTGRGYGSQVLSWAEKETSQHGKTRLRLNCLADNRKLRDFYEGKGFVLQRLIEEPRGTASLYEKRLGRRPVKSKA